MAEWEPVIGLEIHAELATKSKVFCRCPVTWNAPPNTATCPVCLGFPGVLPVVNEKAAENVLKVALALNCRINSPSIFERKNYYYPDLPKGYQISQKRLPIGYDGWLDITVNGATKRVRIADVHLEEDTARSVHGEEAGDPTASLIDFNRSGIPLCEIITCPDMNSLDELDTFMAELRQLLLYLGVSECRMERGQLRFEASVSLRPKGSDQLGTRVEIKNLNSFRAVLGAVEAEIRRQTDLLSKGGVVRQQTMLWNETMKITEPMRTKETAHDYRYFPEPDLVPIVVTPAWLERLKAELPELPKQRLERFVRQYAVGEAEARWLTAAPAIADYFETATKVCGDAKSVANWMMGDLQGLLNDAGKGWDECPVPPEHLGEMVTLMRDGVISVRIAKDVLKEMFATGKSARRIVEERGWVQITDEAALRRLAEAIVAANPKAVQEFQSGNEKVLGFFVGQLMRATQGKANPQLANRLVREVLSQLAPQKG
ncbi:Aspartyl/glutamyl-tRNA(Asn/Gln) amidotransferase subunit B [bacterium HR17]|uniref:Aspartyl/glutamyl-tRNA(Asn/Gln) amidotransferase subunit B n=1 Tax=Candidatus Fervidibacter japonicus TaxID=2035412 RepID=A0A2H5XDI0_9BACT|nr:Aspartyl/glutamyl-tRNA(Asn/Gln) amidotransferase subunit B [bacterium HR17]